MKKCFIFLLFYCVTIFGQQVKLSNESLVPNLVYVSIAKPNLVRIIKDSTMTLVDEPTFAKLKNIDFHNGIIEVSVLSKLLKNASPTARGFIGIAFRISKKNDAFEAIYIRPTNGRANDQVRRNHSTQYFSYPNHKFDELRKTSPEKYESFADMGLNEWIKLRIEVKGSEAKLFINGYKYPSLVVNDLKLGNANSGGIGLWVDVGTEGFFKDLKIINRQ